MWPNTPDILHAYLQEGGRPAFRIRLALAGTLSPCYGIYNGFELCENAPIPGREEYIHSEKYEYKVWDWDRPGNIKRDVAGTSYCRCTSGESRGPRNFGSRRRLPGMSCPGAVSNSIWFSTRRSTRRCSIGCCRDIEVR